MENPYTLEDLYPEGFGKKLIKKARRAVELGGAYMDGRSPDWLDIVDLGTLDLDNMKNCVMGQVLGQVAYSRLLRAQGAKYMVRHGFLSGSYGTELVTQAWREYIWDRRAQQAQRWSVLEAEGED